MVKETIFLIFFIQRYNNHVSIVSFDKSLNKNLQKGQMDKLVRIWSNEKKMVGTRYFNTEFMGGAKAEKILQTFEKGINKLNPESFIQISS